MSNFIESLKKPVGPLPMGAWLVVVGVGLGIAYYSWKHKPAATSAAVADTSTDPGVGVGGGQFVYEAPATVTTPPITDNEVWAKTAINELIAEGYDPTSADAAIRRYVAGEKPDTKDSSLLNIVLGKLGAPPGLLPSVQSGPALVGYFNAPGDPAVWAAYSDQTRRWITKQDWNNITAEQGGVMPTPNVVNQANSFWTDYAVVGITPPPANTPGDQSGHWWDK